MPFIFYQFSNTPSSVTGTETCLILVSNAVSKLALYNALGIYLPPSIAHKLFCCSKERLDNLKLSRSINCQGFSAGFSTLVLRFGNLFSSKTIFDWKKLITSDRS